MIKLLLPIGLGLAGVAGGIGAGLTLKPAPEDSVEINPCGDPSADMAKAPSGEVPDPDAAKELAGTSEYVKLNNQFVVPVVAKDRVDSLVVLSLSLEVEQGQSDLIYGSEPKLRDVFLQVLFDHANMGGFAGAFTNSNNMDVLRVSLTEAAHGVLGAKIKGVLVTDIGRQDI